MKGVLALWSQTENSPTRLGEKDRPPYNVEGEVCLWDVMQFGSVLYISAPSFLGLLLPATGLWGVLMQKTSWMRFGASNSSNCEERVQVILLRLPKRCLTFESGSHYFPIQTDQCRRVSGGSCHSERWLWVVVYQMIFLESSCLKEIRSSSHKGSSVWVCV